MPKYDEEFIPQTFYHIFDRANGDELLFRSDENYNFFFFKMKKYLSSLFTFYSYCLLPNHFHWVIRTKSIDELLDNNIEINRETYNKTYLQTCSNFLNSYAKSYNKYYNRKGSLFIERIKRVQLKTNQDIINAIFYVHKNPVHHDYTFKLGDWNQSSYNLIANDQNDDLVQSKNVIKIFGCKEEFLKVHSQYLHK